MPEETDREDLLTGGLRRRWGTWTRTKILGVALILAVVLATIVTTTVVVTRPGKDIVIPTTEKPFSPTPTSSPTTRTTNMTTTIPITTEKPSTTTVTPTPTITTETPTTTEKPSTTETPTTTEKPTTTTEEPIITTPTTLNPSSSATTPTPPFHPTTTKPFPKNATDYPPVSLLIDMGMRPKFTNIPCYTSVPPTFKYVVEILGTHNYTGVARQKELAKTASAMAAAEAIFDLHYPSPIPPPKYPCRDEEES